MLIKGLTLIQIADAAKAAGAFRIMGGEMKGRYFNVTLRMNPQTPTRKKDRENNSHPAMKYRKIGFSGKWTFAVCFHGFEAFMRECFKLNPDTVIRTTRAAYYGLADFEQKFENVGNSEAGSAFNPMLYRDCCKCGV